jgi:hypothetical protein
MSRRPRRAALLGWTALLWVPLLVLGTIAIGTWVRADGAVRAYRDDRADAAATFDSLSWVPVEDWKAPFGQGTAMLRDGGPPTLALFQLDRALRSAPDDARCDVQTNRATALTLIADDLHAQALEHAEWTILLPQVLAGTIVPPDPAPWGDLTLAEVIDAGTDLAERAASRYGEAAAAVEDPSCEDQRDQDEQQDAQDQADGLRDQQQQSEDLSDQMQQDGSPQDGGGQDDGSGDPQDQGGSGGGGQTPEEQAEQQRQQELQDRNQRAGEEDQGSGGGTDPGEGGEGGTSQPW